jgi:hypothetical protein
LLSTVVATVASATPTAVVDGIGIYHGRQQLCRVDRLCLQMQRRHTTVGHWHWLWASNHWWTGNPERSGQTPLRRLHVDPVLRLQPTSMYALWYGLCYGLLLSTTGVRYELSAVAFAHHPWAHLDGTPGRGEIRSQERRCGGDFASERSQEKLLRWVFLPGLSCQASTTTRNGQTDLVSLNNGCSRDRGETKKGCTRDVVAPRAAAIGLMEGLMKSSDACSDPFDA